MLLFDIPQMVVDCVRARDCPRGPYVGRESLRIQIQKNGRNVTKNSNMIPSREEEDIKPAI